MLILSVKHPIFGLEDVVSISWHVVRSILEGRGLVLEIKALKLLCRKQYDLGTMIVGSESISSASLRELNLPGPVSCYCGEGCRFHFGNEIFTSELKKRGFHFSLWKGTELVEQSFFAIQHDHGFIKFSAISPKWQIHCSNLYLQNNSSEKPLEDLIAALLYCAYVVFILCDWIMMIRCYLQNITNVAFHLYT